VVSDDGDEPQTGREDLVVDHGGVVEEVALLDGEGVDLRHHDPAEGIGDRRVDVHEVEFGVVTIIAEKVNAEVVTKLGEVPGVVFAWPVSGEVVAGNVRYRLSVDADNLQLIVVRIGCNTKWIALASTTYISAVRVY